MRISNVHPTEYIGEIVDVPHLLLLRLLAKIGTKLAENAHKQQKSFLLTWKLSDTIRQDITINEH